MEQPKLSKDWNCLMDSKVVDLCLPDDIKDLLVEVAEGTPQYICTTTKGGPQSIIRSMQLLENSLSCIDTALHSEVYSCFLQVRPLIRLRSLACIFFDIRLWLAMNIYFTTSAA